MNEQMDLEIIQKAEIAKKQGESVNAIGDGCCCRSKKRSEKEYKDLLNRLSRIEGQIRGIRGMVEKDAYCIDILTQVSAANSALNSFTKILLENHIRTCVAEEARQGGSEKIDELVKTLQKLMK